MAKICLYKLSGSQEQEVFVGVNGMGYRIRRGMEVEVPEEVAEVLHNAETARANNDRFLQDRRGGI